jgi:hypothetical protein
MTLETDSLLSLLEELWMHPWGERALKWLSHYVKEKLGELLPIEMATIQLIDHLKMKRDHAEQQVRENTLDLENENDEAPSPMPGNKAGVPFHSMDELHAYRQAEIHKWSKRLSLVDTKLDDALAELLRDREDNSPLVDWLTEVYVPEIERALQGVPPSSFSHPRPIRPRPIRPRP